MRDGGLWEAARRVCGEFCLCDSCLGRLLVKRGGGSSPRALGKRVRPDGAAGAGCFVCGDLMSRLDPLAAMVLERMREYDFDTFSVGATMKPSILDRDDYVRSHLRARGADSVKGALTQELARIISRRSGRKADRLNPDVTVLVDTRFGSCEIRSRHVVVQAKYTKEERGIPQKRDACPTCSGTGCGDCGFSGDVGPSVESVLAEFLLGVLGGTGVRFTWVGGEDRSSLVLGRGRRLYAQIKNPMRRNISVRDLAGPGGLFFSDISPVPDVPRRMPRFRSVIRIRVETDADPSSLRRLRTLVGDVSVEDRPGRASIKRVHALRYRRMTGGALRILVEVDGGMPVKRFVSGEGVAPSVSGALGTACTCIVFDFVDIVTNGVPPAGMGGGQGAPPPDAR